MSRSFLKKIPLYLTSALLLITPFLFLPIIAEKDAFRLPKEAFSLFMISLICGIRGVMFVEERFGGTEKIFKKNMFSLFFKREKLASLLLLFCLYMFVSSLFSSVRGLSLQVSFNIIVYTLFFLFLVSNISTTREISIIKNSLIYPGVIMSVYSFFQYHGYDPLFLPKEPYMKKFLLTSGFIDNPNLFAGYLVALIPLTLAGAITEKKRGGKILSASSFLILLTALVLTNARTGLVAFLASALLFFILSNRWGLKKYLIIGTVLAALLSGLFFVTNQIYMAQSRKGMELPDKSFDVRLIHWKSAWLMISESPWSFLFGKGAGTFKLHYLDYRAQAVKEMNVHVRFENSRHAHNEYIQLWAESGIISIILIGIILVFFIKTLSSCYAAEDLSRKKRLIVTGYLVSFTAVLINALASFPFHIVPSALAALTSAGLLISTLKGETKGSGNWIAGF